MLVVPVRRRVEHHGVALPHRKIYCAKSAYVAVWSIADAREIMEFRKRVRQHLCRGTAVAPAQSSKAPMNSYS